MCEGTGRLSRLVLVPKALIAIVRSRVFLKEAVGRQWKHVDCMVVCRLGWEVPDGAEAPSWVIDHLSQ